MSKISKYPAATTPADADITIMVQGGATKKVTLSVLKAYFNASDLLNNFAGSGAPGVGDDSADGYASGSVWIDIVASPKEAYRCASASVGAAIWLKTTLTVDELGTAALLNAEAATAANDFLVGGSSPLSWIRKTLAEVKTILGIGGSVPAPVAANDFVIASGSPLDWVKKTLAEIKTILGIGGSVPAPVAANDFVIASGSPLDWVKKTLAEVKTILGIGGTIPSPTVVNDFIVGAGSPLDWAKKTLAEVLVILMPTPGPIGETTPGSIRGTNKEIYVTSGVASPITALTAAQCSGTIVSNYGMTHEDCTTDLPIAIEGLSFVCILPTVQPHFFNLKGAAGSGDKIYLLGVAGSPEGFVGVASGYATGSSASFFTFKASDGGFDWFVIPIFGTWIAG